jgi:hypothetical protein
MTISIVISESIVNALAEHANIFGSISNQHAGPEYSSGSNMTLASIGEGLFLIANC